MRGLLLAFVLNLAGANAPLPAAGRGLAETEVDQAIYAPVQAAVDAGRALLRQAWRPRATELQWPALQPQHWRDRAEINPGNSGFVVAACLRRFSFEQNVACSTLHARRLVRNVASAATGRIDRDPPCMP